MVFLGLSGSTPLSAAERPRSPSFFAKVNAGLLNPKKWIEDHLEFASLFRCLMHAPEVLMLDTENPNVIKVTSLLAALGTGSKLSYELLKNRETTAAQLLLYPLPKIGLYSISELYNLIRILDAEYVAEKNGELNKDHTLRNLKITQFMQLMTELAIRICSFSSTFIDPHDTQGGGNALAFYLSEIADAVELWRLLSRWWMIMRFKVKADISIETDEKEIPSKMVEVSHTTPKSYVSATI